jgi:4-amino-4-deoxy-L-arabinose transferase-like glycosyltransferase
MTLGLTAILALGAFLRLWQAGESLWIDELHTSWVVSGKLSEVLPRAAMGNQSPLYFWGMWLLVQVTGQSEWTLRLPSLLAGIALPAAVYFLVGRSFRAVQDNPDGPEGPSSSPHWRRRCSWPSTRRASSMRRRRGRMPG